MSIDLDPDGKYKSEFIALIKEGCPEDQNPETYTYEMVNKYRLDYYNNNIFNKIMIALFANFQDIHKFIDETVKKASHHSQRQEISIHVQNAFNTFLDKATQYTLFYAADVFRMKIGVLRLKQWKQLLTKMSAAENDEERYRLFWIWLNYKNYMSYEIGVIEI